MGKEKKKKKASPPTPLRMERGVETNVYHTLERYKNQGDEGR
jgi:hypothetical protein